MLLFLLLFLLLFFVVVNNGAAVLTLMMDSFACVLVLQVQLSTVEKEQKNSLKRGRGVWGMRQCYQDEYLYLTL